QRHRTQAPDGNARYARGKMNVQSVVMEVADQSVQSTGRHSAGRRDDARQAFDADENIGMLEIAEPQVPKPTLVRFGFVTEDSDHPQPQITVSLEQVDQTS